MTGRLFCLFAYACLLISGSSIGFPTADAAEFAGVVISVKDGDTVMVLTDDQVRHVVRLAGIDAPEKRQSYGAASQSYLSTLVAGRTVKLSWKKKDRYGRTIAKITVNHQDVALSLLEAGLAWHYKRFEREQSREEALAYAAAELRAKQTQAGLWQDPQAVPPWIWRKRPN